MPESERPETVRFVPLLPGRRRAGRPVRDGFRPDRRAREPGLQEAVLRRHRQPRALRPREPRPVPRRRRHPGRGRPRLQHLLLRPVRGEGRRAGPGRVPGRRPRQGPLPRRDASVVRTCAGLLDDAPGLLVHAGARLPALPGRQGLRPRPLGRERPPPPVGNRTCPPSSSPAAAAASTASSSPSSTLKKFPALEAKPGDWGRDLLGARRRPRASAACRSGTAQTRLPLFGPGAPPPS
ncbi:MAG: hypothetical protein MZW92_41490 [Comamonadaceae bacterium]|nr:hypothetical protein [Comamonadaceae bacterium]